jgi:hypothetical protein
MNNSSLEAVPVCPWCGSAERSPARSFSNAPNRYVSAVAAKIGTPVETLLESMSVYACDSCGTSYCDPWLSGSIRQWLFSLGQAQHFAAWERFYLWLERRHDFENEIVPRAEKIWRHVVSRVGPVDSYAEVACPFMGLFGYFRSLGKSDPVADFVAFEKTCAHQAASALQPHFIRRVPSLQRAALGFKRRRIASRSRQNPRRSPAPDAAAAPKTLTLLRAQTSLAWQNNCQSLGVSCAGMAASLYDVNLDDIWKTGARFDVIGFFNTLDHQDEPLRVLEKALRQARAVAIELHDDGEAGKQHLFAINNALQNTARARNWYLEEFTAMANSNNTGESDRLYLVAADPSVIAAR